jgi:hypothetical protein
MMLRCDCTSENVVNTCIFAIETNKHDQLALLESLRIFQKVLILKKIQTGFQYIIAL